MFFPKWLGDLLCRHGYHLWVRNRRKRFCQRCGRREVWYAGSWIHHTYPLDADPKLDPTPIGDEGPYNTIGWEAVWADMMKELEARQKRYKPWASYYDTHDWDQRTQLCRDCGMNAPHVHYNQLRCPVLERHRDSKGYISFDH